MKYLILLILVYVAVSFVRRAVRGGHKQEQEKGARPPESMVKCSYCGVNQPISESLLVDGRYYCCENHQREAGVRRAR
ncbi:PP0621 family protein [Propionivibrio soli]|uniref:PP0621 family protein n=1 Tax=Propionivibrio soli TaxID=2976531 RepID=UPI003B849BD2